MCCDAMPEPSPRLDSINVQMMERGSATCRALWITEVPAGAIAWPGYRGGRRRANQAGVKGRMLVWSAPPTVTADGKAPVRLDHRCGLCRPWQAVCRPATCGSIGLLRNPRPKTVSCGGGQCKVRTPDPWEIRVTPDPFQSGRSCGLVSGNNPNGPG